MVSRDRPFALCAGTSTAAAQPPSARRSHAIWRAFIDGSSSNPLDL
jgi:hypothetical protein